ncbi:MAG: hypothetical protein AAF708_21355 [Deinococcota bacterium]
MKRLWILLMVMALALAAAQPMNGRRERSFSERVQFAEDRVLFAFLDDFTAAIERHDWEHVLSHFYEETYLIQTQEFGLNDAEFIIGAMGLDMVDNALMQTTGADSGFVALNQIDTITILERINSGIGAAELQGNITLIDGGKLSITLFLRQSPTGRYEIVSPVG